MKSPDAERISVVCYYRENMAMCDSMEEEELKKAEIAERKLVKDNTGVVKKFMEEKFETTS
jgi:hypothetical protein